MRMSFSFLPRPSFRTAVTMRACIFALVWRSKRRPSTGRLCSAFQKDPSTDIMPRESLLPRRIHPFEHLRKYAVYRRALLSYLALSALTVLVVSAVLFVAFGRQSTRDITESGE